MTSRDRTYYEELDVREDATPSRVRAAFRKLARKYHPDRNPRDDTAEAAFKRVNKAYLVLGDAAKRVAYDRRLKAARETAETERAERQAEQARADEQDQARTTERARTAEHGAPPGAEPASKGTERSARAAVPDSRLDGGWARVGFWGPVVLTLLLALAYAWFALAIGLGLIGWSTRRRMTGRRALVAAVLRKPDRPWMTFASFGFGALLVLRCVPAVLEIHRDRVRAAQQARDRAEADAQRSRDHTKAEAQRVHDRGEAEAALPTRIAIWRDELAQAQKMEDHWEAQRVLVRMEAELDAEKKGLGSPPSPSLVAIGDDLHAQKGTLEARLYLLTSLELANTFTTMGREAVQGEDWLAADDDYRWASEHLREVEAAPASDKAYVPRGYDFSQKKNELAGLRQLIAGPVALEWKKRAYEARCGPSPVLGKDGDTAGVKALIQRRAHDPDSIEVVDCTTPVLSTDDCWVFRCNVRGKNALAAKVLQTLAFQKTRSGFHEALRNGDNPNPALVIEGPAPP